MLAYTNPAKDKAHAEHVVQLYEADERVLRRNVSRYLSDGLRAGSVMVVATPEHRANFVDDLRRGGAWPDRAIEQRRLVLLDARELLGRFLVGGYPDAARFDAVIGTLVRETLAASEKNGLRIYGEMVAVLWEAKQFPAAIRLEQLWNSLRRSVPFDLFCAYQIDVFSEQFDSTVVAALLHAHTHLLETAGPGDLERAIDRAIVEVLGVRPLELDRPRAAPLGATAVPGAEATILWLRSERPNEAGEILSRARGYYRAAASHR